jgi:hypothetical protein
LFPKTAFKKAFQALDKDGSTAVNAEVQAAKLDV